MLLPDHIYRRVPLFWMIMGTLFLVFGLMAGPDFHYFSAYMLLGLVCIGRSIWLHQARQRVARRPEVTVLTDTQKMERKLR
jgi:hypothetical protein